MIPIAVTVVANILQPLIDIANAVLEAFHNWGLSWGGAIIALTIATRTLLIPLTYKQLKGMRALQAFQPQIKELQEKYKNDRQRLSQEMMKFYQENKINPLASCIPLLAQMPIFITLFYTLRGPLREDMCGQTAKPCGEVFNPATGSLGGWGESFLFIPDLTAKAVGGVLIVLIVLYVGDPADFGTDHGHHRRPQPANPDDGAAVHLHSFHPRLPGRPDPLLDHHQLLDDRAAGSGQQGDPAAGKTRSTGGDRGQGSSAPSAPQEETPPLAA